MKISEHTLNIFADYFQFYLQDELATGELDEGDWQTPGALERLLVLGPGTICVGTARNMTVPVQIEIYAQREDDLLVDWDQVNECSINVPSGSLVVYGCTDYVPNAIRIKVVPGEYRARILYRNLDSLSANGLEGDDQYVVKLWREPLADLVIMKQRAIPKKADSNE